MTLGSTKNSHHATQIVYIVNACSFRCSVLILKKCLKKKDDRDTLLIIPDCGKIGNLLTDSRTALSFIITDLGTGFREE